MNSNLNLELSSYDYKLPEELIARRPAADRHSSRLMVYHHQTGKIEHSYFYKLASHLSSKTHLVLNQSSVYPARLTGRTITGGKCEVLLLSLQAKEGVYPAMIKSNHKKKLGDQFILADGALVATVAEIGVHGEAVFGITFNHQDVYPLLQLHGEIPIPPYIRGGESDEEDRESYQTVYAHKGKLGSVAAPTAGLHFSDQVFSSLDEKGIGRSFVTLHVGMGTFLPVKCNNILDHKMHTEVYQVDDSDAKTILEHQGELVAVGTTSLRVLESCFEEGKGIHFNSGKLESTNIFLYPGKKVSSVKGIITNFHLPCSTLLMLVSALIGREKTLALYEEAIKEKYRFYSYGDAMMILLK